MREESTRELLSCFDHGLVVSCQPVPEGICTPRRGGGVCRAHRVGRLFANCARLVRQGVTTTSGLSVIFFKVLEFLNIKTGLVPSTERRMSGTMISPSEQPRVFKYLQIWQIAQRFQSEMR